MKMTFSSDAEAYAFMEWLRDIPKAGDPPVSRVVAEKLYPVWKREPLVRSA